MVTLEKLRGYEFFTHLTDTEITRLIPLVAEEFFTYNSIFFEEGQSADFIYLVTRGSVDLYFKMPDDPRHRVLAGEINAVEPIGISALMEPYVYAMRARAGTDCSVLRIHAAELRELMEQDPHLGYVLMREIAKASMERMHLAQQRLAEEEQPEPVI